MWRPLARDFRRRLKTGPWMRRLSFMGLAASLCCWLLVSLAFGVSTLTSMRSKTNALQQLNGMLLKNSIQPPTSSITKSSPTLDALPEWSKTAPTWKQGYANSNDATINKEIL